MSIHIYPKIGSGGNYDPPIPQSDVIGLQTDLSNKLSIKRSITLAENVSQWDLIKANGKRLRPFAGISVPATLFNGAATLFNSAYIGNNKHVFIWYLSNVVYGCVFDETTNVTGTVTTLWSPGGAVTGLNCCWDSTNNRFVLVGVYNSQAYASTFTVSGTTLSVAMTATAISGITTASFRAMIYIPEKNRVVLHSNQGLIAGEVTTSPEAISWGSPTAVAGTVAELYYDSSVDRLLLVYTTSYWIYYGNYSISGSTITAISTGNQLVYYSGASSFEVAKLSDGKYLFLTFSASSSYQYQGFITKIIITITANGVSKSSNTTLDWKGNVTNNIVHDAQYDPIDGALYLVYFANGYYYLGKYFYDSDADDIILQETLSLPLYVNIPTSSKCRISANADRGGMTIMYSTNEAAGISIILNPLEPFEAIGIMAESGTSGQTKNYYIFGSIIENFKSGIAGRNLFIEPSGVAGTGKSFYQIGQWIDTTTVLTFIPSAGEVIN